MLYIKKEYLLEPSGLACCVELHIWRRCEERSAISILQENVGVAKIGAGTEINVKLWLISNW